MNLDKALQQLDTARAKQRILRKEIDQLREFIRKRGVDPDAPKIDLSGRNKTIFKEWKNGKTFVAIGNQYHLSSTTIANICHRIEKHFERKDYDKYKDLLDTDKQRINKRSQSK